MDKTSGKKTGEMEEAEAIENMEDVEEGDISKKTNDEEEEAMEQKEGSDIAEEIGYYYRLGSKWTVPSYLIQETPSVKRGMSVAEETAARRRGIRLVTYLARSLALSAEERMLPGKLVEEVEIPKLFAMSVHMFHRFYMVHPVQIFNEFVMAVAIVYHAAKIIEEGLTITRLIETVHINASSCEWIDVPEELSFEKKDSAELWQKEILDLEQIVFTTLCPIRLFFDNVFDSIISVIQKLIYNQAGLREDEAIQVRDKAFGVASQVYGSGCHLVVTEKSSVVAVLCVLMAYGDKSITEWKGGQVAGYYWFNFIEKSLTLEKLQSMWQFVEENFKEFNASKGVTSTSQKMMDDDGASALLTVNQIPTEN